MKRLSIWVRKQNAEGWEECLYNALVRLELLDSRSVFTKLVLWSELGNLSCVLKWAEKLNSFFHIQSFLINLMINQARSLRKLRAHAASCNSTRQVNVTAFNLSLSVKWSWMAHASWRGECRSPLLLITATQTCFVACALLNW